MITSAENQKIRHLRKLIGDRKYRYQEKQFVVEGYRQLEGARAVLDVYVSSAAKVPDLAVPSANMHIIEERIFNRLADTENTQGVLAVCALACETALSAGTSYVLLDGLQDPGNAGTIIRTAAAFGYGGVIFTPGCVDPFSPKVVRATMGAIFKCAIVLLDDFQPLQGCQVVAADLNGPDIAAAEVTRPYILAIGNEARGFSAGLRPWISRTVTIPLRAGSVNSLNAAVAAGIAMYALTVQRLQPGPAEAGIAVLGT
jgi:TrmH family RNA methyltransferase